MLSDNGSSDGSTELARSWEGRLNLTVVDASTRRGSIGFSRNVAAARAHGEVLAFCDADDRVHHGWLAALAEAAEPCFGGGALDYFSLNGWAPPWKAQALHGPQVCLGTRQCADSANLAVKADVFWGPGAFGEQLQQCWDVDLSWRLAHVGVQPAVQLEDLIL